MSVSDFDRRRTASESFVQEGLAASLTRSAQRLISSAGAWKDPIKEYVTAAFPYAGAELLECVFWAGKGRWIGYFDDLSLWPRGEGVLLIETSSNLADEKIGRSFSEFREMTIRANSTIDAEFVRRFITQSELQRPMVEWFPLFQATLIASEALTVGPINAFFLYLRHGNPELFLQETPLSADSVMKALQETDDDSIVFQAVHEPASVLAGFIRFTEFLSTMGSLFPGFTVNTELVKSQDLFIESIDRELLLRELRPFTWRVPEGERADNAMRSVLSAFINLVDAEFHKNPGMAVQWSREQTFIEILDLTHRFFGNILTEEDELQGFENSSYGEEVRFKHAAMRRRSQELGLMTEPHISPLDSKRTPAKPDDDEEEPAGTLY